MASQVALRMIGLSCAVALAVGVATAIGGDPVAWRYALYAGVPLSLVRPTVTLAKSRMYAQVAPLSAVGLQALVAVVAALASMMVFIYAAATMARVVDDVPIAAAAEALRGALLWGSAFVLMGVTVGVAVIWLLVLGILIASARH